MTEKKKPKDHLGEILGVPSIIENNSLAIIPNGNIQHQDETTRNAIADYKEARQNIRTLIETGNEILDDIAIIAKQGQQPRAYEVAANMMKTLLEANKDLLSLNKTFQNIEQKEPEDKAFVKNTTITNNNLHLTTAEMQEMLENKSKKT